LIINRLDWHPTDVAFSWCTSITNEIEHE